MHYFFMFCALPTRLRWNDSVLPWSHVRNTKVLSRLSHTSLYTTRTPHVHTYTHIPSPPPRHTQVSWYTNDTISLSYLWLPRHWVGQNIVLTSVLPAGAPTGLLPYEPTYGAVAALLPLRTP